jgi:hypothetical protein
MATGHPINSKLEEIESDLSPTPTSSPMPTTKRKRPSTLKADICDTHSLPHVGNRKNSICSECFLRGHIGTSRTICPKMILLTGIEKSKRGNSWRGAIDTYRWNRKKLVVMMGHMKELGDVRYVGLENVVADFDSVANGTLLSTLTSLLDLVADAK